MFDTEAKILIVDDMKMMRKLIKGALASFGYKNVVAAADGNEAWELLTSQQNFDFVISDWNMPVCTGIELLKRVRGDSSLGSIPFIILTAEAETEQVSEALTAGVDDYILKPFTPAALSQKMDNAHKKFMARSA